jgi:GNAT superfamily N-acetyltransferase
MSNIIIRPATEHDAELLVQFIHDLARYERLHGDCIVTPESLREQLFGAHPAAEAVIGEYDGKPEGFAIFFPTFSTFAAKPKLYLEDLFVNPEARGKGIGKALLMHLVQIASERNYRAVEWAVLDWNEPAIGFYKKLGAVVMDDWHVFRLTEDVIQNLSTQSVAA